MNLTSLPFGMPVKSACTTPFTTGKLDITKGQRSSLFILDLVILFVNLSANTAAIYALVKTQQLKRRPSISLILYLCMSDCSFAVSAQILFAVKIFNPELPCIYDLMFEFLSSVLADLSLCLVVLISLSRYLHTRYMVRVKLIITRTRVKVALCGAIMVATLFSSVSLFGSTYGETNVYLQTEIFSTTVGVVLIMLVAAIYRKTEMIARRRKAASHYELRFACFSEKVLKKIMISTLATLLPLRIPFFASTVVKVVMTDKMGQKLTWWMQYIHLACYEVFCLSAGANALIFLHNNTVARKLIRGVYDHWMIELGIRKKGRSGTIVEPLPHAGSPPPLIEPVVTTGWYDRYVPTEAPTTLSTAVVGKKVWQADKKRRAQLEKEKRKRKRRRRKEKILKRRSTKNRGKTDDKHKPEAVQQNHKLGTPPLPSPMETHRKDENLDRIFELL